MPTLLSISKQISFLLRRQFRWDILKFKSSMAGAPSRSPFLRRALHVLYWCPLGIAFTEYFYTLKVIRGRSMQPTLNPDTSRWNDIVILDRFSVGTGEPLERGDVVSLRDPTNSSKTIVKRVVAVASDTIRTLPPYPVIETIVPEGHIWVEGDEPFRSLDSNTFGPVPLALVDAKIYRIIWPIHRIGPLKWSTPLAMSPVVHHSESQSPGDSDMDENEGSIDGKR